MHRFRIEDLTDSVVGVLAVAATYTYFLLFAQFGFLHLLEQRLSTAAWRPAMAAMGVSGLLASLAVAYCYRRFAPMQWIQLGFLGCAVSAGGALLCTNSLPFIGVALAIGVSTGTLTVSLAAGLRHLLPLRRMGLCAGLGTGLAYGICNLPWLFGGSPTVKIVTVIVACAVGLAAVRLFAIRAGGSNRNCGIDGSSDHPALDKSAFAGWGFAAILVSFLALVWLDSAAFLIIQETETWKSHTWGNGGRQLLLGACHFVAAVLAGWWIDRGGFRSILLTAWGLFVLAFTTLQHSAALVDATGPVYVLGISFYSTALVVFPSLGAETAGRVTRHWRAAWIFGIGGWIGSALGVGMAQDLHHIPKVFLGLTGIVLVIATLTGLSLSSRPADQPWRRLAQTHGLTLAGAGIALGLQWLPFPSTQGSTPESQSFAPEPQSFAHSQDALIAHGRRIYIREGCIHCHSQYIRPVGDDLDRYGPHRAIDREDRPVLIGNRRQGPDLTWSGRYRDVDWLEKHLKNPRSTSPGSRMPAFDHLFEKQPEDPVNRTPRKADGDALVAYLASKKGPIEHSDRQSRETAVLDAQPQPFADVPSEAQP